MKEYAVYKGEEILKIGTAKELAAFLNIKVDSIYFYNNKAYKKRLENRKTKSALVVVDISGWELEL